MHLSIRFSPPAANLPRPTHCWWPSGTSSSHRHTPIFQKGHSSSDSHQLFLYLDNLFCCVLFTVRRFLGSQLRKLLTWTLSLYSRQQDQQLQGVLCQVQSALIHGAPPMLVHMI